MNPYFNVKHLSRVSGLWTACGEAHLLRGQGLSKLPGFLPTIGPDPLLRDLRLWVRGAVRDQQQDPKKLQIL